MSDEEAKKKSSQALREGQVDIRKRLYAVEAEGGRVETMRLRERATCDILCTYFNLFVVGEETKTKPILEMMWRNC